MSETTQEGAAMPEMHAVTSSNIAAIGYRADDQTVYVRFLNGSIYIYKGVPREEFETLRSAESVGRHFNKNFRSIYPFERIPPSKDAV